MCPPDSQQYKILPPRHLTPTFFRNHKASYMRNAWWCRCRSRYMTYTVGASVGGGGCAGAGADAGAAPFSLLRATWRRRGCQRRIGDHALCCVRCGLVELNDQIWIPYSLFLILICLKPSFLLIYFPHSCCTLAALAAVPGSHGEGVRGRGVTGGGRGETGVLGSHQLSSSSLPYPQEFSIFKWC